MTQRVLITGGAGFIGARLAERHLEAGDAVHLIVRRGGPSRPDRIPWGASVHHVDLADVEEVEDCLALAAPETVYHLASGTGRDPRIPSPFTFDDLTDDLRTLLTLLGAASHSRRPPRVLVRADSLAVYGDGPTPSVEDQRERPLTIYTAAMVAGAHYCQMLGPELGFPVLSARLALVYGPGQSEEFLLPWLIRRCLEGETSRVRRPECRRDMVFVDDVVEGLRLLAASGLAGGTIVNLSTGVAPTVREIAGMVIEATRADPALVRIRQEQGSSRRVDDICGDPSRARNLLGWVARTPLRDGIRATVDSMSALAPA